MPKNSEIHGKKYMGTGSGIIIDIFKGAPVLRHKLINA
jgi:hypothetical protein